MYQDGDNFSFYVPLQKSKDKDGNRIIYGVASDESIDTSQEVVDSSGIKESLDYFLKHGAIDYDHRAHHFDKDPKFLIGEPMDGKVKDKKFYLKAKLYKGMPIADTVWGLMQNGAKMGFSVGGKVLKTKKTIDANGRPMTRIQKVLMTHVAVTKHPVNAETEAKTKDSWKVFAKSLHKDEDGSTDIVKAIESYYKRESDKLKQKDDVLRKATMVLVKSIISKSMSTVNSAELMKESLEKDSDKKKAKSKLKVFRKKVKELTKARIYAVLDQYAFIKGKGIPKQDGSGMGVGANKGRGGCDPLEEKGLKKKKKKTARRRQGKGQKLEI